MDQRCAGSFALRRFRPHLRSRRRSARSGVAAADHQPSGGEPVAFLDARPADRRRPRAFDARDTRTSPVCIVNEAFARSLGGRSPIGMRVSFKVAGQPQDQPNAGEIVGVAKQVKAAGRAEGLRADLRAAHARSCPTTSSCWCARRAAAPRSDARGARGDFTHRQGAAGERSRRDDAGGCRVGGEPPASAP